MIETCLCSAREIGSLSCPSSPCLLFVVLFLLAVVHVFFFESAAIIHTSTVRGLKQVQSIEVTANGMLREAGLVQEEWVGLLLQEHCRLTVNIGVPLFVNEEVRSPCSIVYQGVSRLQREEPVWEVESTYAYRNSENNQKGRGFPSTINIGTLLYLYLLINADNEWRMTTIYCILLGSPFLFT
jgi:hypothetical protein